MALASVTIPEWLRPWHGAGVWHLLAEEPLASERGLPSPSCAVSPSAPDMLPSALQARQQAAPVKPNLLPPPLRPVAAGPQPPPAPRPASLSRPASANLDSGRWPGQWQKLFAKARPAPVLWTYHELGLDLLGGGEAARGALFRRLLSELRLPKGTSAFWPTAVPQEAPGSANAATDSDFGPLEANAPVFWAGMTLLKPRVMVVFGVAALQDMGLDAADFPLFQQRIFEGKLIVHVPDMSHLLANEAHLMPALSLLKAVLHSFTIT